MFTAALFTIARTWKQPKCPLTEEWIKKVWCVYTHTHTHTHTHREYYSAIRKNKAMWCTHTHTHTHTRTHTQIQRVLLLSHKKE